MAKPNLLIAIKLFSKSAKKFFIVAMHDEIDVPI